jgi:hypothetical protein
MRLDSFIRSKFRNSYNTYYLSHGVRPSNIADLSWQKSSWSGYNGNCVEVSHLEDGRVGIRDTKDLGRGPILFFTRPEWDAFLSGAKHGEFDR